MCDFILISINNKVKKNISDKIDYEKGEYKASFICTIYTPVQIYTRGVSLHLGCILVM